MGLKNFGVLFLKFGIQDPRKLLSIILPRVTLHQSMRAHDH